MTATPQMLAVQERGGASPAAANPPRNAIPLSALLAVAGVIVFLYWPIFLKLLHDWWTDPNFSHGFFVPLFAGYVAWQTRPRLKLCPPRPSWWGAVIITLSLAVLVVGVLGSELFLSRTSFVVMLAGLVIFLFGWKHFRILLFPWLTLFLMIPIPTIVFNQITFPLQIFASKVASFSLPVFSVPVMREGNVIRLPQISLEVAEACSGIRSLLSLVTLAIIYSYFLEPKVSRGVLLVILSIPIAVAANAARIVLTGLMVQYWDADKALGFFHEFSGWLIFLVSLALLIAAHRIISLVMNRLQTQHS